MRVGGFCIALLLLPAQILAEEASWYVAGTLQAGLFLDSIYTDPYLRAGRTPVFGKNGGSDLDADNTCIPTDLGSDGNVLDCRDLYADFPVFSGTVSGTRVRVGHKAENHNVFAESALIGDRNDPYIPTLYRLWADYKYGSLGYGWSTFSDFDQDFYPQFLDYNGPVGIPYKRQYVVRWNLGAGFYVGMEEPQNDVYRGFGVAENVPAGITNSDTVFNTPITYEVELANRENRRYAVDRRLRTRGILPDFIFTYYKEAARQTWFVSLLLRYINLDRNAPLFLDEDNGLLELTKDAADPDVLRSLEQELQLNQDLAGGKSLVSPGLHIGARWEIGKASGLRLAYIYNGGSYLRDHTNPSYLVVPDKISEGEAESYKLVEIVTHSYVAGFDFGEGFNLLFSGITTEDEYATFLGGGATQSIHSLHFNYLHEVYEGLDLIYEVGYLYHETFNGRNNGAYPRLRMLHGVRYSF